MQLELPFLNPLQNRAEPPTDRIEFVRMRRARRYILRVRSDGSLRVTVPRGGSRREAEAFVAENRKWIERERRRVDVEHAPLDWRHGSRMLLRGESVFIHATPSGAGLEVRYGERRITGGLGQNIRAVIESDLRQLARSELIARLQELAGQHGLQVRAVSIRNQRSRWGSCARNGNIALNFRLVQMPPWVSDYVLLHELMHLRQQNHSRRYWRLVEQVCPDFRAAERWLRVDGKALF